MTFFGQHTSAPGSIAARRTAGGIALSTSLLLCLLLASCAPERPPQTDADADQPAEQTHPEQPAGDTHPERLTPPSRNRGRSRSRISAPKPRLCRSPSATLTRESPTSASRRTPHGSPGVPPPGGDRKPVRLGLEGYDEIWIVPEDRAQVPPRGREPSGTTGGSASGPHASRRSARSAPTRAARRSRPRPRTAGSRAPARWSTATRSWASWRCR